MWMEAFNPTEINEYRLKETGELLPVAICSRCSVRVILLSNQLEGVLESDERIIISGIRGI